MPTADDLLADFSRVMRRDRDQGFSSRNPHSVQEALTLALAAIAVSLNDLAKKETDPR